MPLFLLLVVIVFQVVLLANYVEALKLGEATANDDSPSEEDVAAAAAKAPVVGVGLLWFLVLPYS